MRRRLILFAAAWAAVVGLVAGSAQAQSPAAPGGGFVLSGIVVLENGGGLAWIQEPSFTNNKVVTVRLGDSVGPYRVTKILTHQVELSGPGGTVTVPLAGLPGAVSVASRAGTPGPGAPGGETPNAETASAGTPSAGGEPSVAAEVSQPRGLEIPRGDPRRRFPASKILIGAGATVSDPSQTVPMPSAMPAPAPSSNKQGGGDYTVGDPRTAFPTKAILIGG